MSNQRVTGSKPEIHELLSGQVCIVGVGNRQRGDDGAGPRLIDSRHSDAQGVWLDAGVAPENYLETIARTNPDTVLIVDAVDFGGAAGEYRWIDASALKTTAVSTHAGSLATLSEYLTARTNAIVHVIAIQPERVDAREGLSLPVEKSVLQLAALLSIAPASAKMTEPTHP
jgi:hydrogenase 3 maturation protease